MGTAAVIAAVEAEAAVLAGALDGSRRRPGSVRPGAFRGGSTIWWGTW
jgi:hypothetical protein